MTKPKTQKKNIALIGMPGAYKTTVGKLLASKISFMSFDTDEYLEFERGMSITQFVSKYGIDVFRSLESACIANAVSYVKAVISTGGGAVINPANVEALTKHCVVIYLYATPNTLFKRIGKQNNRPLLTPNTLETITDLYNQRKSLYESCADIIINTNKMTSKAVADLIATKLEKVNIH